MRLPRMLSKQCFPFLMNPDLLPALGIMLYCLGRAERRAYSSSWRKHQLQPLYLCAAQVPLLWRATLIAYPDYPSFLPSLYAKNLLPQNTSKVFPCFA